MRKPRDYNSELKALTDKTRLLKDRWVRQLGELVIATAADALDPDTLTGALLMIVETKDAEKREAWRSRGASFFRVQSRKAGGRAESDAGGDQTQQSDGPAR